MIPDLPDATDVTEDPPADAEGAVTEREEAEQADEALAGQSPSVEAPLPEAQDEDRALADRAAEAAEATEAAPLPEAQDEDRALADRGAEPKPVPEPEAISEPGPGEEAESASVADEVPPPVPESPAELSEEPAAAVAEGIEAQIEEPEAAPEPAQAEPDAGIPDAAEAEEEPEAGIPITEGDPFAGPGEWYVIHTYAGYENKVKTNLGSRIQSMQMQDRIFDVVVPMEDVMEIKGGRKQVVQKKVFPGYLLVKMVYDNDSWYVVRNTPGVTGFVASGTGQKPTPLPRREVEKFLIAPKEEAKPAFRLDFEEGDVVRIISGPFADFTGTIQEINLDQSKVKVMVNIFDRETPVELGFDDITRV